MLKILFWSNEKWRDEAPNRLVRRLEPAGGHFIPSQMAAHDANSGSGPFRRIPPCIGVMFPTKESDEGKLEYELNPVASDFVSTYYKSGWIGKDSCTRSGAGHPPEGMKTVGRYLPDKWWRALVL